MVALPPMQGYATEAAMTPPPTGSDLTAGIMLDFTGAESGQETGERPILQAENVQCDECGQQHDIEVCPKCSSFIGLGYGLMGGGCGVYKYCLNEACDWFWKREDEHE